MLDSIDAQNSLLNPRIFISLSEEFEKSNTMIKHLI